MTDVRYAHETPLELIERVLADLGSLDRSQRSGTLTEPQYDLLVVRMRQRLQLLRSIEADEGEGPLELTDAGKAAMAALNVGQSPQVQELIRRAPGLLMAQTLKDSGFTGRARLYGPFAAIEGDRP